MKVYLQDASFTLNTEWDNLKDDFNTTDCQLSVNIVCKRVYIACCSCKLAPVGNMLNAGIGVCSQIVLYA